jgi:AraC-like DNA-binding protein
VDSSHYTNDTSTNVLGPRRLLIKHTLTGTGVLHVGRRRFELTPGSVFMIERPGPYVYCYEGEGEPWTFEFVSVVCQGPSSLLPKRLAAKPIWDLGEQSRLRQELAELIDLCLSEERESLRASALAYRFYLNLIEARQGGRRVHPAAEQLHRLLEQHFRNSNLHLGDLSREVGLTQEALSRIFKREYGESPAKALNRLRLAEARRCLESGSLGLKEVANRSGFGSANYLCRLFRSAYSMTPAAYRANPDPLLGG